jgi:hypothetical protein
MRALSPGHVVFSFTAVLAACGGSAGSAAPDGLTIAVAPLSLPGIGKVCYDLEVTNAPGHGGDVVWSKGTPGLNRGTPDGGAICSDRFGNTSGGDVSYVGPCDADGVGGERMNSVTIWFDGLYDLEGSYIVPDGSQGWQNPCVNASGAEVGCTLDVLCKENADTAVSFDFTVMREANQGFFDVAVNFEDIFCSAKIDCRDALLHNGQSAGSTRDATAVVAFACTSGTNQKTVLQVSDLTLACDGLAPMTIPASAAPGQHPGVAPGVFGSAVYQGDELLSSGGAPLAKCYWNRAIGLDQAALSGRSCHLTGAASASVDGIVPPVGATAYPVVRFDVEVSNAAGVLCGPNPLNGPGSGVQSDYLRADNALEGAAQLTASFTCAACSAEVDTTCDGVDDDCDGQTDEDYVSDATTCGVGVCTNTGVRTCVDGAVVDGCEPKPYDSNTNTFDDADLDAGVVHAAVYRGTQHCDDLTATTPAGLLCAPEPGWRESGGVDGGGYVFGTAKDQNERHYGLTVDTVALPNLLGGRISGYFRTLKVDQSGPGAVKAQEGAGNSTAAATTGTARARWLITSKNNQTGVIWIWVSKDAFAWNPNDDLTWTQHGIDVVWENFAQWQPFVSASYAGGSAQQFADSVNNVTRIGVLMSDASILYAKHLDASWYRTWRYGVMSAIAPSEIELGWDELSLTATGSDCNANGVDDDCNGFIDDCAPR